MFLRFLLWIVVAIIEGICFSLSLYLFFPDTGLLFHTDTSQVLFTQASIAVAVVGLIVAAVPFIYMERQRMASKKKRRSFSLIAFGVLAIYFMICMGASDMWLGLLHACSDTC